MATAALLATVCLAQTLPSVNEVGGEVYRRSKFSLFRIAGCFSLVIAVIGFALRVAVFLCTDCAPPGDPLAYIAKTCTDSSRYVATVDGKNTVIECEPEGENRLPPDATALQLLVDSSRLPTLGLLESYKYCWFVRDTAPEGSFRVALCSLTTDGP